MQNIELKVILNNFDQTINLLQNFGAKHQGTLHQIDTYYQCNIGRLKIREINNQSQELIFYQRPDTTLSKISQYQIIRITNKQIKTIKHLLHISLGEKVIVEKERDLWLYQNTRIHLDKVYGLGCFLELETVIKKDITEAREEHLEVVKLLNLQKFPKIDRSYSDILQPIIDHRAKVTAQTF
ncbi:MAG: class IV adenylate cyclase [Candidatus Staskawiczbacteria bacterium]|nr:class IV adenylate cyclase [Candidatus Staskawiczbacteria bacterium]